LSEAETAAPAPAPFDRVFEDAIIPALAPFEAERRQLVGWFWTVVFWSVAGTVLIGAGLALYYRDIESAKLALLIGFAGVAFGYRRLHKFEKRCKVEILSRLAEGLGLTYRSEFAPPGFDKLMELGMLPGHDRASFDDLFGGVRQNCRFQLYEAHLEVRQSSNKQQSWRTVFRGQVIELAFPKKFLGVTVVNRDGVRHWRKAGFERVGLGASSFEKLFEVYGTDQVEARFLVHPAFMERLIALETASAGHGVRCAFVEGSLLIAVESGDLFEVANVFKAVPDKELTRKGVAELEEVMGVIDVVMAPPPRAYASSGSSSSQGGSSSVGGGSGGV
jgi:hypothetical protein